MSGMRLPNPFSNSAPSHTLSPTPHSQETLAADLPPSLAVPKTPAKAPAAPAKAKAKTAEEEELEALQAELAM